MVGSRAPVQPRKFPPSVRVRKHASGCRNCGTKPAVSISITRPWAMPYSIDCSASCSNNRPLSGSIFIQRIGSIAHDLVTRPSRVAGVATIDFLDAKTASARYGQQRVDAGATASLFRPEARLQIDYLATGRRIDRFRRGVGMKVAEVGTNDDKRLAPAPYRLDRRCHGLGRRQTDNHRNQQKIAECNLKKR